jgi:hypothetical protein
MSAIVWCFFFVIEGVLYTMPMYISLFVNIRLNFKSYGLNELHIRQYAYLF